MTFSRRFFRSVKLSLISKLCLFKRRLTQSGSCHLRSGLRVAHVKHPLQAAAAGGNKLSANVEGKKIRAARPWWSSGLVTRILINISHQLIRASFFGFFFFAFPPSMSCDGCCAARLFCRARSCSDNHIVVIVWREYVCSFFLLMFFFGGWRVEKWLVLFRRTTLILLL